MPCDNDRLSVYVECYEEVESDVKDFVEVIKDIERTVLLGREVDEYDLLKMLRFWKSVITYIDELEEAVLLGPEEELNMARASQELGEILDLAMKISEKAKNLQDEVDELP